jgi:hypothetical protein
MKKRLLFNPSGNVGIVDPALASRKKGEAESDWLERVFAKATPEGVGYQDTEDENLIGNIDILSWNETGAYIDPSKQDAIDSEDQRLAEIEDAQEASGFRKKSVAEAHEKIDKIFENATTVEQLRSDCIQAFKIIATFILK